MKNTQVAAWWSILVAVVALIVGPLPANDEPPTTGQVNIKVYRPDGTPLAETAVRLTPAHYTWNGNPPPVSRTGKTDKDGVVHVEWPAGATAIDVSAKGVGYGITELLHVSKKKPVQTAVLPLVPFAEISGTVPDGEGCTVNIGATWLERPPPIVVGTGNRFSFEVRAGTWSINAVKDKATIAVSDHSFHLTPGAVVRDVRLQKLLPKATTNAAFGGMMQEWPEKPTMTWAQGTIRDEAGQAVSGASVYVVASDLYGARFEERVVKTTTDAQGHYAIIGESGLKFFSATIVAAKMGFVPGFSWFSLPSPQWVEVPVGATQPSKRMKTIPSPRRDLVLSRQGGKLEVHVWQDDKPVEGASVEITAGVIGRMALDGQRTENAPEVEVADILHPSSKTDATGAARFEMLPPGDYEIMVTSGDASARDYKRELFPENFQQPFGAIDHSMVRVGGQTTQDVALDLLPKTVRFNARDPDGKELPGFLPVQWGRVNAPLCRGYPGPIGNQIAEWNFQSCGLWHIELGVDRAWDDGLPYDAAIAVIGISPRLNHRLPIDLATRRLNAGSIHVELRDIRGKPARGVVEVGDEIGEPVRVGSTDDMGRIFIEHVQPGRTFVRGYLPVPQPPVIDEFSDSSFPDDAALLGQEFISPQSTFPAEDTEQTIVVQSRPAGYIRGVFHPAPGHKTEEFRLTVDQLSYERGGHVQYRRETGEFVAGPLLAGDVTITASREIRPAGDSNFVRIARQCEAVPGKITRLDITAPNERPASARASSILIGAAGQIEQGMGEEEMVGRVFLPDGETPAYGALLQYFASDETESHVIGLTDAGGNIHGRSERYAVTPPAPPSPDSPHGSVIVATLPGVRGGVIVKPPQHRDDKLSIILPRAVRLRGKVTIGGRPPGREPGEVKVLAAYEGKGKLNAALSVWATPTNDGNFELSGLTPGAYRVQTALDEIWLSETVSVTASDHDLPFITLDIGAPGGAAVIHCADQNGTPVVNAAVVVTHPAGPLANLYWPPEFKTDGMGNAFVPALTSGRNIVREKNSTVAQSFDAPPLPAQGPTIVNLRVVR